MLTEITVKARCLKGQISTDDILPARYKHMFVDPSELGKHLFEDFNAPFGRSLTAGDAIVLLQGIFGIGSSREQAVTALKAGGVRAIIAPAFGRIFFRNAWNNALPCFELAGPEMAEGEKLRVDFDQCEIRGASREWRIAATIPLFREMIAVGGLLTLLQKNYGSSQARI